MRKKNNGVISTNCKSIDELLSGGFPCGQISLIYGKSNTGKTSLAIQCSVICARNNSKTIFVDNENSFSPVRLSQIAGNDIDKISPFIILFNPLNFNEQSTLIENLELYINQRIVLIVFDTIISLYRNEFGVTEKIFALNRRLNRQLAFLSKIVKFYNVAILLTSQVRSNLQYNVNKKIEPVAHRLLRFWSQNIIRLEKTEKNGIRKAVLEKYDYELRDDHRPFVLDMEGIKNLKT